MSNKNDVFYKKCRILKKSVYVHLKLVMILRWARTTRVSGLEELETFFDTL